MIPLSALHELLLRSAEADLALPAWQKDLLDGREEAIESGKAKFIDWELAKKEILEAVR
jgi:hypothetical protein